MKQFHICQQHFSNNKEGRFNIFSNLLATKIIFNIIQNNVTYNKYYTLLEIIIRVLPIITNNKYYIYISINIYIYIYIYIYII